ncbi:MAG: alpha/beta hydrolase-fold protein [Planctomycetota bacterium]|nr:alpha/beta hydrolase-fold protein [Planctomycetota bacterium]
MHWFVRVGSMIGLWSVLVGWLPPMHAQQTSGAKSESAKSATAKVTWQLTVPEGTPASSKVYIAGSIDAFGPWQPDALEMAKQEDGTYRADVELPIGTRVEYKFTRGSWATVEKTPQGAEVQNRTFSVRGPETLRVAIAGWGIPKAAPSSTATGDLRWMDFESGVLGSKRRVTVWLPPQYRDEGRESFPVVYCLDGQNLFDQRRAAFGVEWEADETARALASGPANRPLILVGIDNSKDRFDEYTPVADEVSGNRVGGKADAYLRFLVTELRPWIDREYRTLKTAEATAIVGSSLGGVFVLHALRKHPEVFGNGAAMSPSLFWGQGYTIQQYSQQYSQPPSDPALRNKQRLWLDIGTAEGKSNRGQVQAVEQTEQLAKAIEQYHSERIEVRTMIDSEAKHHEAAWARRLPIALEFLFSSPDEGGSK